jgi:hypothetical protein
MARNPELIAHQEWLGYVQPVGLVVSTPALLAAQAYINKNIIPEHQRFLECVEPIILHHEAYEEREEKNENLRALRALRGEDTAMTVADFPRFLQEVLDWQAADLIGDGRLESLEVVLPEYGETLRPTYAVREVEPDDAQGNPWLMLIQTLRTGVDLDALSKTDDHKWQASPHAHFERLLRETKVPIGLLFNGTHLRLVYAPRGETSGYLTFPVDAMAQVDGRPIFAGLHLLLSAERLFTLPRKQRLPYLLSESRKYQNLVSTQLSEQVLHSLYELLRGFQAADDTLHGELLRQVLKEDPNHVYAGLLNVLLRLVFVLYAEDRGLMPGDSVYGNFYSINGLFERLRSDASRFPDTMDQRYGAWAQLLSLFRLIHDGASHGATFKLPPRQGHLFNPDRYPFLEGRPYRSTRQISETIQPPMVSDGIVFRVLHNLLILDGERLSYRTLDVEQIGSVYETVMGFTLEVAQGRSIAIKPTKPHGAPLTINLDALLETKPGSRAKWVKEQADQSITGSALQDAATPEDLVAALGKKASPTTPRIVPPGAMILQPSDERRRSGSHYTPRSLTEPIVRTTLRPVLEQLGDKPTPEQILDLKVCDPAMGSGAFLVEADRQLADELVKAWHTHHCVPAIPPDEDEVLFARRLVVQRCLYGVDKNPMAVDVAKLALWLATLAKDHAFTFVDHALRCGDSLVGLTRQQIAAFHWQPTKYVGEIEHIITERIQQAMDLRARIQNADETISETTLRLMLKDSQDALDVVRAIGDSVVAAFFFSEKPKERESKRSEYLAELTHTMAIWSAVAERSDDTALAGLAPGPIQSGDTILECGGNDAALAGLAPGPIQSGVAASLCHRTPDVDAAALQAFHWQIEFPEVFQRDNPGFDAFVGNPPFMGGSKISSTNGNSYRDWLLGIHDESHGNADLVAHFFRRTFSLLRQQGALGLIATNTIGQGDTRSTGLRWICTHGGTVYSARRRYKWPGQAAVVVSVVHVCNGALPDPYELDGKPVPAITAFLFHAGGSENPSSLHANAGKSFLGSKIYGQGFTFDDTDTKGVATPIDEMHRLIEEDPRNAEVIFPYIGGEEVNSSPTHEYHRYVINFFDRNEAECRQQWPELMRIVEEKVKPERLAQNREIRARYWWRFGEVAPALYATIRGMKRVLGCSLVTTHLSFAFLPASMTFSHKLVIVAISSPGMLCILQSRIHESFARFFSSTLGDALNYSPSDCFETFPFPAGFEGDGGLESVGQEYYEFRAALMVRNNEGLTKTYNRFHDPEEQSPDVLRLRELHAAMDRAVLDAYGWTDLEPTCEFLLDYEEEDPASSDDYAVASPGRGRGRKKPWRYRWPDEFRDDVLARLLELNRQYAEEERLSGAAAEKTGKRKAKRERERKDSTTKGAKGTKEEKAGKEGKGKDEKQGDLF